MFPGYDQLCPLDNSELVSLGGWSNHRGKHDAAYYYCPRCDAGFVCWGNPTNPILDTFIWRRRGNELLLDPMDEARVAEYLAHDWEVAKSSLLDGVGLFLQHRFSEGQGCPNDGGRIPLVAEFFSHDGSPVRFHWCGYCGELFAYLKDEHYGSQYMTSFSHDNAEGYKLWKVFRDTPFADLIRECVASVPPPSAFGH